MTLISRAQAEYFMRAALNEGKKAIDKCKPNSPVGCVLVKNGDIISKGHTNEPGHLHAEAMALNQISGNLKDVIAFVTLEPCSFHGRTPSCALEFVNRNIKKVYIGMIDPHPKNQGAGVDILTKAGVPVEIGLLSKEIKEELEPYLIVYP